MAANARESQNNINLGSEALVDLERFIQTFASASGSSSLSSYRRGGLGKEKEPEHAAPSESSRASPAFSGVSKPVHDLAQLVDKLVILEDALDGIKTTCDDRQWTRDATAAFDIDNRLPRDHERFQTVQMLCRCLTRLAAVWHAIEHKCKGKPVLYGILLTLKAEVVALLEQHESMLAGRTEAPQSEAYFKETEQVFNDKLIAALGRANLLTGIFTQQKAEKLLFHCKNLFSVLRPARVVVTVTQAPTADDGSIYLQSTHRPITQKTQAQKLALKKLLDVRLSSADGKTLHRQMPIAMQEVSAIFEPLIARDDTALPAQARKFIAHTLKNPWQVEETLYENNPLLDANAVICQANDVPCTLQYMRAGSPVPTADISKQEMHAAGRENLLQAQMANVAENEDRINARQPRLCVLNLMTDMPYQFQKQVVDIERDLAVALPDVGVVVAPTAFHGKLHAPIVSASAAELFDILPVKSPNFTMEAAIQMVANIASQVLQKGLEDNGNSQLLIHCASGQDRTHTAIIRLLGDWFGAYLKNKTTPVRLGVNPQDNRPYENAFVRLFILGNVGPFLNSILVPGAPGLKSDSMDKSIIPLEGAPLKAVLKQLYLKSAGRNKQNPTSDEVKPVLVPTYPNRKAFRSDVENLLNEVQRNVLPELLQGYWDKMQEVEAAATQWRLNPKEQKTLRDGVYNLVSVFQPFQKQEEFSADKLASLAEEFVAVGEGFRKAFYRPAINTLGLAIMGIGIAIAVTAMVMLCLAFIPGSPLILALGISAQFLAKISLVTLVFGLIPTGVGAGIFGGERAQRYHNPVSQTLAGQAADIQARQSWESSDDKPEGVEPDTAEPGSNSAANPS